MGNIVLLDDLTINKIAAGEVIERPASVVKEVVENSIDAGADNISIEIKNGGISYIRVTDNGKGIAADDLEIAFERHATSKIRSAEDLETVKSMGFRGEALASIAAIARVELVSKTEDSETGHRIVVEGGKILLKEEIGCPKGTSITIENLFFNTPVRYKFLKKDFTESGYIEDSVARIALVNPNISIKLISSGKTVIQTSGNGDIKDIVYGIYGKDVAENIINVEYYFEDMVVKGVIGKPSVARSNRSNQIFFVNKRYVKDKTLTSAAEQAFKGMLPIGKYGFLILNIEIDSHKLDVNVHPAKLEVRFQDENKIFKLVYHAIKEALLKVDVLEQENKSDDDGLFNKSYIEEIGKTDDNILLDNRKINEDNSESKGISGFFKNILGGVKHESSTKDDNLDNLVEQLYKDKIQREQDNILGSIKDESEYINDPIINKTNKLTENIEHSYNNVIVGNDGNLDLKSFEKKDNSISKDFGNVSQDTKNTTNLERLIKELDENLEKLSLKSQTIDIRNLNEDEFKQENEKEQGISASETNTIANELVENKELNQNIEEPIESIKQNLENEVLENNNEKNKNFIENTDINIKNDIKSQITNISENIEQVSKIKEKEEPDLDFEEMYAKMFGTNISRRNRVEEKEEEKGYTVKQEDLKTVENVSLFTNNTFYNRAVYKFIGIVFGSYIVIEYENEMYIVNQRAANERILYEKVKENYNKEIDKDSQLMLLPDVINLTDRQMGIANDNIELFKKNGFCVEEFGENTIKLSAVPSICLELDTKQLFLDILDEINTVARTAKKEVEDKFMATVACKAAEKSAIVLTAQQVDILMQQLLSLPQPFNNPNGQPTAIRMSKLDIEKKFSRR